MAGRKEGRTKKNDPDKPSQKILRHMDRKKIKERKNR